MKAAVHASAVDSFRRSCLLSGGHRQGDLQGDAEVFGHSDAALGRGDAGRPGQDPC